MPFRLSVVHILEPGTLTFPEGWTDGGERVGKEGAEGQEDLGALEEEKEEKEEVLRHQMVLEAAKSAGFDGCVKVVELHEVFQGVERRQRLRRLLQVRGRVGMLLNWCVFGLMRSHEYVNGPASPDLDVPGGNLVCCSHISSIIAP